jgi:chemotaxis signal transduction protein
VTAAWLVFRLGPYVLCASALDVEGIIRRPEGLTKFPLTPDYALGAFLFRDRSAAALSLRTKLKLRQGEDSVNGPFIVARVGDGRIAFWVDEVKDVIEEKDAEWRPMPPMLEGGLFQRFGLRADDVILQTSFAALKETDAEFESVASWLATQVATTPPTVQDPAVHVVPKTAAPSVATVETMDQVEAPVAPAVSPLQSRPARPRPPVRERVAPAPPGLVEVARPRPSINPIATVAAPSNVQTDLVQSDSFSDTARTVPPTRVAIAAAIALAAMGILLYQFLMPEPRKTAVAPIVQAAPSPQPILVPSIVVEPPPVALRPAPVEPRTLVLTIEPPSAKAATSVTRVHTVVRGDTLWHIAKSQVGDPFQYPELAKLSNIRNPDLIHPGDLVRIEIRTAK